MFDFIAGLITMGFVIAGLFFLKFWVRTRDALFAVFAIAFWLLAANQGIVAFLRIPREEWTWVYLLRLAAFTLIIAAILYKNFGGRAHRS